jgi:plastocyanin
MSRRRTPRAALALALALLPVALVACGGSDDGGAVADGEPGQVRVVDNAFKPKVTEIATGDTVTWSFEGSAVHNVHGPGFASKNLKDGTFEHTFNSAGTVKYQCTIHPGMTGEIKVS